MESGNEIYQQFLKNFIQSLQTGSEDSNSLSESSLNPNAAEFVPSHLKVNEREENAPNRSPTKKPEATSTTTLVVDNETVGDAVPITRVDTQSRIQRLLFNQMNRLGSQSVPLTEIQFSLAPNGQDVNVQFISQESSNRQQLDEKLCLAASLRLKVGDHALQSTRPGNAVAAYFLSRMSDVLNREPALCPKCTAFPKRRIYSESEIERQIEDIKEFENLINEDAGARYQDAFKELCQKLGLTTNGEQLLNSDSPPDEAVAALEENNEVNDDEEHSPYEWDSFTTDYASMRGFKYTGPSVSEENLSELMEQEQQEEHQKEQLPVKNDVPSASAAMSMHSSDASSAYPKLFKVGQGKCSSAPSNRKIVTKDMDKESKLQRWRHNPPSTVAAGTKLPDPPYVKGSRSKSHQGGLQSKASVAKNLPEVLGTRIAKATAGLARHQPEQGNVTSIGSKLNKAATLSRVSGPGQVQGAKQSAVGAQRLVAPRSTQASKMRQSEVKRRLNLMRGDNDTDVQFNEYLFK